jgi:uncharacterized protein (DUF1684 family)
MSVEPDSSTDPDISAEQRAWARLRESRLLAFDGWIAIALLLVLSGGAGVIAGIHTDGGPPLLSRWPVFAGCVFVLGSVILAVAVAGRVLSRTILVVAETGAPAQTRSAGSALPPQTMTETRSPDDGT